MKNFLALVFSIAVSGALADDPHNALTLWYKQPAREWVEALPVGNGRLGAMVFGGTTNEQIQLNEDTIWSGAPRTYEPPSAAARIPEIRQMLFDGKFTEAEALARKVLLPGPRGDNTSYQTLGDLFINSDLPGEPGDYRRSLNLDTAVATTTFTANGVKFRRDVFSSKPDNAIVIHLSADAPGKINFTARLERANTEFKAENNNTPLMTGKAVSGGGTNGVKFAAVLRAVADGGKVWTRDNKISVSNANSVTLILTAESNYNRKDPASPLKDDFAKRALADAKAAARRSFASLKSRSVADHQALFRRVDLALSTHPQPLPGGEQTRTPMASNSLPGRGQGWVRRADSIPESQPTDERLEAVKIGEDDPSLVALYFQYGRYLLICSSRPGDMPANLQGIWCKDTAAPWGSDYHININIQMNYWPADVCNLAECQQPFFDFVEALANASGRKIAKDFYGARGFVGHYTTDAWLYTPTGGDLKWALWQMGGAWCTRHFIEHYWFTGDKKFLKERAYPILSDAASFLLDWLTEDPKTHKLVSGPSASPENEFIGPDGNKHSVAMGNSMDQEVCWDTFNNFLAAARELRISNALTAEVQSALERLAWPGIASDGRLMEWAHEFEEPEPGHRHLSHLFGIHPGYQFTQHKTPEYMAAARKTIDYRLSHGGGHTGWSRAWIVNFWARFHDADKAYENVQALLAKSTLKNLFDNHPPFQIDGNFGGTAGIAEMLIQSHDGEIWLLPALPKQWNTGHFNGLRARGGFEVSAQWKDGKVERAEVKSLLGKPCRVRFNDRARNFETAAGKTYRLRGESLELLQ